MDWIRGADEEAGLIFYTATGPEEEQEEATPQTPPSSKLPRKPRKQPATGGIPTGTGSQEKPKRVTTASLAASMDQLLTLVPSLTSQSQTLSQRQDALETKVIAPTRATALGLSQPLSAGLANFQGSAGAVAGVIAAPQPRTKDQPGRTLGTGLDLRPTELRSLEEDKPVTMSGDTDLAKAMLAQSQAITALVGQIGQGDQDPLLDLTSSSSSASTKESQGRARLQAELAQDPST
eukprot:s4_g46.t1